MATLGKRLAKARKKKGWKQIDLAVALGDRYSQSLISQIERGRSGISTDGLAKAARELGVSADYLLCLVDDHESAALPTPVGGDSRATHLSRLSEDSTGYSTDTPGILHILQLAGISFANKGSIVPSKIESFPVSRDYLARHQIDPSQARIAEVEGQSMYPLCLEVRSSWLTLPEHGWRTT